MLGVHDARAGGAGKGSDERLPQSGGVGKVEVHHIEVPLDQHLPEAQHPPQIGVVGGTERVHRRSSGRYRRHQGVLVAQYVGYLVADSLTVDRSHHVHQQTLGTAVAQALDHQEHTQRWSGQPGR